MGIEEEVKQIMAFKLPDDATDEEKEELQKEILELFDILGVDVRYVGIYNDETGQMRQ